MPLLKQLHNTIKKHHITKSKIHFNKLASFQAEKEQENSVQIMTGIGVGTIEG